MFYGLNKFIKNLLPKRLFYRALLIVAAPIIILQITISIVFFDSLWIKTNKGMTRALVGEIKTFINAYDNEEYNKESLVNLFKKNLEFNVKFEPSKLFPKDDPERWLNISWDNSSHNSTFSNARISVVLKNQPGSLGKITTVIAKNNGNISNINFSIRKIDFFEIIIDIEVRDNNHLNNIMAALRLLSEISSLERVKG